MVGVLATPMDPVTAGTTVGITDGVGTIHTAGTMVGAGTTVGGTAMIPTDMDTTPTAGTMVGTTAGVGTTVGITTLGHRQVETAPVQEQPAQQRPVLLLELTTATVDHQNTLLHEVLE